jgi:hypothetical protein
VVGSKTVAEAGAKPVVSSVVCSSIWSWMLAGEKMMTDMIFRDSIHTDCLITQPGKILSRKVEILSRIDEVSITKCGFRKQSQWKSRAFVIDRRKIPGSSP